MADWNADLERILKEPRNVRLLEEKESKDSGELGDLILYKKQCLKEVIGLVKRYKNEGNSDPVFLSAAEGAAAALGSEIALFEIEKKAAGKGFFGRLSVKIALAFLVFASGFFLIFSLAAFFRLPVLGETAFSFFGFFESLGFDMQLVIYAVLVGTAAVLLPIILVFLMSRYQ